MKKIIINGGEFYKLHRVYSATINFSANTQTALLNIKAGQLYRVESSLTTARYDLYNGVYLVSRGQSAVVLEDGKATYTARGYQDSTLYMRYAEAQTSVVVEVYEVTKYATFDEYFPYGAVTAIIGSNDYYKYLQPTMVSGKTYHYEFTPLYDGKFSLYDSDSTAIVTNQACTNGQTFSYDYTAVANDGYLKWRSFVNAVRVLIKANEV